MTQKDIQKNNNLYKYGIKFPDTNLSVSPFGQNKVAEIAYKKAERLVIATYLVTNFVPQNESVRENIRKYAQRLLSDVLDLREGMRSTGPGRARAVMASTRHILSLIDVLHASGYATTMNVEVLKTAYADFARFLRKSLDRDVAEQVELDPEYFMSVSTDDKGQKSQGQKDILKDKSVTDILVEKDAITDKKVSGGSQDTARPQSLRNKRKATSRRMAILDAVTKRGPVHIKDIATEVTECSEKTIQRELSSLVHDGVVKKEGTKRWTTYVLVV